METKSQLRAEIARLRDLLEENGIDPEPYVAPPPQFGPPTLMEWQFHRLSVSLLNDLANKMAREIVEPNPLVEGRPTGPIRIRLPTDFTVRS